MTRDPRFDDYVLKIHTALDKLDYYRLLGVERTTNSGDVRKAFYQITAKFHPDRNRDAPANVGKALYDIFKRLNEAYRVLSTPERKRLYDEGLTDGKLRLDTESRKATPKSAEDTIMSKEARQFFHQAAEELKKGAVMQAELHLKLAKAREPQNAAIDELLGKIAEAKRAQKP